RRWPDGAQRPERAFGHAGAPVARCTFECFKSTAKGPRRTANPSTSRPVAMNAPVPPPADALPPYRHTPLFPLGKDETPYRKISAEGVRVETVLGREMLVISRAALQ